VVLMPCCYYIWHYCCCYICLLLFHASGASCCYICLLLLFVLQGSENLSCQFCLKCWLTSFSAKFVHSIGSFLAKVMPKFSADFFTN
jgi:hypothetical protein